MRGTALTMYDAVAIVFMMVTVSALIMMLYVASSNVVFADMHVHHVKNKTQIAITIFSPSKIVILNGVEVYAERNESVFKYSIGMVGDSCQITDGIKLVGISLDKMCEGVPIPSGSTLTIVLNGYVNVDRVSLFLKVNATSAKVDVYR